MMSVLWVFSVLAGLLVLGFIALQIWFVLHVRPAEPFEPTAGEREQLQLYQSPASWFEANLGGLTGSVQAAPAQTRGALAATTRSYAIPSGALGDVLQRLARESKVALVVPAEAVQGKVSQGLSGRFSLQQAFAQVLQPHGLRAIRESDGGYRVAPIGQEAASADDPQSLKGVTVTATAMTLQDNLPAFAGGQVARGGQLGGLGNVDFMDAPVSIDSYTAELIDSQQPRTVTSMLARNNPSVRSGGGAGESTDTSIVRGFGLSGGGDLQLNGLPGIVAQYRSATDFVERIELLKGPSAMLSGMSPGGSVGGTVNLVTKRATDQPVTSFTASYLSDSRPGLHADVGRRFGETNQWGVRLNLAAHDGNTARDHQKNEGFVGALSMDYRAESLRASVDYIRQDSTQHGARGTLYGIARAGVMPEAPEGSNNFDQPWAQQENLSTTAMARVEIDLSPTATAWVTAGTSSSDYTSTTGNAILLNAAGDFTLAASNALFSLDTVAAATGVQGQFSTGSIHHQWVVSASHVETESSIGFLPVSASVDSNIYQPIIIPDPHIVGEPDANPSSEARLPSVAVADSMSFFDNRASVTLGARYQKVKTSNYSRATGELTGSYSDHAVTPFVGVVIKPWGEHVSLYANHSEGLSPGDTAPLEAANAGEALPPYKTKQYEVGAKFDLGNVGATFSVFQIKQPSASLDPVTNVFGITGMQRNRGVEASVFGEPVRGLRLLGGAAWLDAELVATPDGSNEGNAAIGVPDVTANVGIEWDVPGATGLSLIGSLVYTGEAWADEANTIRVPSWTRTDLGVRYAVSWNGHDLTLRGTVENAWDENYWSMNAVGGANLGMPRTYVLSAKLEL